MHVVRSHPAPHRLSLETKNGMYLNSWLGRVGSGYAALECAMYTQVRDMEFHHESKVVVCAMCSWFFWGD